MGRAEGPERTSSSLPGLLIPMRKRFIAAALILTGASALFFLRPQSNTLLTSTTPTATTMVAEKPAIGTNRQTTAPGEIERCLGVPLNGNLEESLLKLVGSPLKRSWKVVRVEAGTQEFRLRLSLEPAEDGSQKNQLKIFAVDEEGLPDLMPEESTGIYLEPEKQMENFIAGKRIISEIESLETSSADAPYLRLEKENGALVEVEFQGSGGKLACSGKAELSCRCL